MNRFDRVPQDLFGLDEIYLDENKIIRDIIAPLSKKDILEDIVNHEEVNGNFPIKRGNSVEMTDEINDYFEEDTKKLEREGDQSVTPSGRDRVLCSNDYEYESFQVIKTEANVQINENAINKVAMLYKGEDYHEFENKEVLNDDQEIIEDANVKINLVKIDESDSASTSSPWSINSREVENENLDNNYEEINNDNDSNNQEIRRGRRRGAQTNYRSTTNFGNVTVSIDDPRYRINRLRNNSAVRRCRNISSDAVYVQCQFCNTWHLERGIGRHMRTNRPCIAIQRHLIRN